MGREVRCELKLVESVESGLTRVELGSWNPERSDAAADGAGDVDNGTEANDSFGRRPFESVAVEGSTTGVEGRDADTKVCLRSGEAFV